MTFLVLARDAKSADALTRRKSVGEEHLRNLEFCVAKGQVIVGELSLEEWRLSKLRCHNKRGT